MIAADLRGAWPPFGGISAQKRNLSVILHLTATESAGAPLAYDTLIPTRLGELARAGQSGRWCRGFLLPAIICTSSGHDSRHCSRYEELATPPVTKVKDPSPDPLAPCNRVWVPRKQYLAHLAAEKRETETAGSDAVSTRTPLRPDRASTAARAIARLRGTNRILVDH